MAIEDQPRSCFPSTARTEDSIGKIRNLVIKIDAGQSTNSKSYPGCTGTQFGAFWNLTWECEKWQQSLWPDFSPGIKVVVAFKPIVEWRRRIERRSPRSKSSSESMCEDDADMFFDIKGIVYSEFVPKNQTVNQQFYVEEFRPVS